MEDEKKEKIIDGFKDYANLNSVFYNIPSGSYKLNIKPSIHGRVVFGSYNDTSMCNDLDGISEDLTRRVMRMFTDYMDDFEGEYRSDKYQALFPEGVDSVFELNVEISNNLSTDEFYQVEEFIKIVRAMNHLDSYRNIREGGGSTLFKYDPPGHIFVLRVKFNGILGISTPNGFDDLVGASIDHYGKDKFLEVFSKFGNNTVNIVI